MENRIADQGYTVYGSRLAGHGTHYDDMENATYQDWIKDVERGLEKLKETCSTIFVDSLSMGGTLVQYLAENHLDTLYIKSKIPYEKKNLLFIF